MQVSSFFALHKLDAIAAGGDASPRKNPREDGALPAPAGLRHPIDWLLHATDAVDTISLGGEYHVHLAVDQRRGVAGRWSAIDDLPRLKLTLEVCCDKIPATHLEPKAS